jgi:hypothetical protein
MLIGNLDREMREFLSRAIPVLIPFFAFALGANLDLSKVWLAGLLGLGLGVGVVVITGIPLFFADRLTGGSGVAGVAAASTAGNAVAVPAIIASANPAYQDAAAQATILSPPASSSPPSVPLVTTWTARRVAKIAIDGPFVVHPRRRSDRAADSASLPRAQAVPAASSGVTRAARTSGRWCSHTTPRPATDAAQPRAVTGKCCNVSCASPARLFKIDSTLRRNPPRKSRRCSTSFSRGAATCVVMAPSFLPWPHCARRPGACAGRALPFTSTARGPGPRACQLVYLLERGPACARHRSRNSTREFEVLEAALAKGKRAMHDAETERPRVLRRPTFP